MATSHGPWRPPTATACEGRAACGNAAVYSCYLGHFCFPEAESSRFVLALQERWAWRRPFALMCPSDGLWARGGEARGAQLEEQQQHQNRVSAVLRAYYGEPLTAPSHCGVAVCAYVVLSVLPACAALRVGGASAPSQRTRSSAEGKESAPRKNQKRSFASKENI